MSLIRFYSASKPSRSSLLLSTALLAASPSPSSADDAALLKLFEILRDRGSISSTEYRELIAVAKSPRTTPAASPSPAPTASTGTARLEKRIADDEKKISELDRKIADSRKKLFDLDEIVDGTSSDLLEKALEGKWYENINWRGYTQFRLTSLFDEPDTPVHLQNDRSVNENESFLIRRGRMILSGDATDHLFVYGQLDFVGGQGGNGDNTLAMRDLYADIAIDADKEFRFRAGQSKVPFGWVNLQSSQNRIAMERPEALNTALEGERDLGLFFYWAPKDVRSTFKSLIKDGLKGSGDYGVLGLGAYSGQGLNRSDANSDAHVVARASYPFKLPGEQILELGAAAYTGKFVPTTGSIRVGDESITPTFADSKGLTDERVGVTAILYPKPFGIEAEWNWGRSPQLARDFRTIGSESLEGGYVQANYRIQHGKANWYPFVRYQRYDGARKFGRNAPWDKVSEFDAGVEWSPWPEIELSVMYTHTFERTNTSVAPYNTVEDADRISFQLQWNY
jgi:hypothetical protein